MLETKGNISSKILIKYTFWIDVAFLFLFLIVWIVLPYWNIRYKCARCGQSISSCECDIFPNSKLVVFYSVVTNQFASHRHFRSRCLQLASFFVSLLHPVAYNMWVNPFKLKMNNTKVWLQAHFNEHLIEGVSKHILPLTNFSVRLATS